MKVSYQKTSDDFVVDFEGRVGVPYWQMNTFFPGVLFEQSIETGRIEKIKVTEAQWVRWLTFQIQIGRLSQLKTEGIERELDDFLVFASQVRPGKDVVTDYAN